MNEHIAYHTYISTNRVISSKTLTLTHLMVHPPTLALNDTHLMEHPSRTPPHEGMGLPQRNYGDTWEGSKLIRTSPKHKTSLIKTFFFCHPQSHTLFYFQNVLDSV